MTASENGFERSVLVLAIGLGLLSLVVISALFPPVHHLAGGTDASNYAHAAEQYRRGLDAGRTFFPPEVSSVDRDELRPALTVPTPGDRIQAVPFVFVDDSDRVLFVHQHLQPRLAALVGAVAGTHVQAHLDLALHGLAVGLVVLVAWRLTGDRAASAVTGAAFAVLPSLIGIARLPMSEPIATVLVLAMLLGALGTGPNRAALTLLPVLVLPHTREEFFLPLALGVVYVVATRPRWWGPLAAASVLSAWVDLVASSVASGDGSLVALGWDPTVTAPTPAAVIDALTDPVAARGLVLPAVLVGALGRARPLRERSRSLVAAISGRIRRAPRLAVAAVVVAVLAGDAYKSSLEPGTLQFGLVRHARYTTGWLLLRWAPVLVVLGVVGLALVLPKLVDRIHPVGWIVLVVLLGGVVVDLHATPANELYWARRFHPVVYPVLALGTAHLLAVGRQRLGRPRRPIAALAVLALLGAQVGLTLDRFPEVRDDFLSISWVEEMNERWAPIEEGDIVLLGADGAAFKVWGWARTVHGAYTFHVNDPGDLEGVVRVFERTGRTVVVDRLLAEQAGLEDGWRDVTTVQGEPGFRAVPLGTLASASVG